MEAVKINPEKCRRLFFSSVYMILLPYLSVAAKKSREVEYRGLTYFILFKFSNYFGKQNHTYHINFFEVQTIRNNCLLIQTIVWCKLEGKPRTNSCYTYLWKWRLEQSIIARYEERNFLILSICAAFPIMLINKY